MLKNRNKKKIILKNFVIKKKGFDDFFFNYFFTIKFYCSGSIEMHLNEKLFWDFISIFSISIDMILHFYCVKKENENV